MKHPIFLMTLLTLAACGKDSHKSAPPTADQNIANSETTHQDELKDNTCKGETCTAKPADVAPKPTVPAPVPEVEETIPDGLVIFKAADHCVAKASGAHSECQPIPRPDAEVKFDLDKVSDTTSKVVADLSFVTTIQYNYFCKGAADDTFLTFGRFIAPIIHGAGEITFSSELHNKGQVALKRNARGFSTVSKNCSIVITGRTSVLTDPSLRQLKQGYDQGDDEEKAAIKTWLETEALRLKASGSPAYDALMASLPATRDPQKSTSL